MGAKGGGHEKYRPTLERRDDGKVEVRRSSCTYVLGARGVVFVKFCLRLGPDVSVVSERHGTSFVKIW